MVRAALLLLLGAGCGKASGLSTSPVTPGAQCPTGGVQITLNGQTQLLCNGTSGTGGTAGSNGNDGTLQLYKQTKLLTGDANCPGGGMRTDGGLDNGKGGGVAGDNILQAGEITSTEYVCTGDRGLRLGSMTPPPGAVGTSTFKAVGGSGSNGAGGDGGAIQISLKGPTNGGHLKVFNTGGADASFTFPTVPLPDLGAVPAVVTASVDVPQDSAQPVDLKAGTLYVFNQTLYAASGSAAAAAPVTGISVAAGVVLTFASQTNISIPRSCFNAGTIAPRAVSATAAGSLTLTCGDYFGDTGSALLATGAPGTATQAGGSGGSITVYADTFWNKGAIDVSGGSGSTGGNAGSFGYLGYRSGNGAVLFNTGPVRARGGDALATPGAGGNGGGITLYSGTDCKNSGALDASGGKGFSTGGSAGSIQLSAYAYDGVLLNSGAVTAVGGSVDSSCASACAAGSGAQIQVFGWNGLLINTGALLSTGGSAPSGSGGSGGEIDVQLYGSDSSNYGSSQIVPTGTMMLAGSLDSSGGSGTAGGSAGLMSIYLEPDSQPNGQELILYGLTSIATSGGAGTTSGGSADSIQIQQANSGPAGAVLEFATLTATGGAGISAAGGNGGSVTVATQMTSAPLNTSFEVAIQAGDIDTSGASGATAGSAGSVSIQGRAGVAVTGAIRSRGGASTAGAGGSGALVQFVSADGALASSSNVDTSGGVGAGAGNPGGAGGLISMDGPGTSNSGTLFSRGGAADLGSAPSGGTGGAGGSVKLTSTTGLVTNTAPLPAGISVQAGAGQTAGAEGFVEIDGRFVTPAWTH